MGSKIYKNLVENNRPYRLCLCLMTKFMVTPLCTYIHMYDVHQMYIGIAKSETIKCKKVDCNIYIDFSYRHSFWGVEAIVFVCLRVWAVGGY